MEYIIKKVEFEISNFSVNSTNIINANLLIHYGQTYSTYKITNYLGKGTVGQVYLIESSDNSNSNSYVIKISNSESIDDLIDEVKLTKHYFKKNNICHASYPIYYGFFKNLKGSGVIYPYFGFYNLEKIKSINYKIDFKNNINIIVQLIKQLKNLTNVIHCDLKPSNIVINIQSNQIYATIIDFGLIRSYTSKKNVISTNFITSPESLLTLSKFYKCNISNELINLSKHDYFGLYCIIINLFVSKTYWSLVLKYLTDIDINDDLLFKQEAINIFAYMWYRFVYDDKEKIVHKQMYNLILEIEVLYPSIINKKFLCFDDFFIKYVCPNINYSIFDKNQLDNFKDFSKSIIQFEYDSRPNFDDLLNHKFLNS